MLVGEFAGCDARALLRVDQSASRMNPMWGPLFGLVIALRALFGEPTFVSTSSTLALGQLARRRGVWPIATNLRRRIDCKDVPGAKRT